MLLSPFSPHKCRKNSSSLTVQTFRYFTYMSTTLSIKFSVFIVFPVSYTLAHFSFELIPLEFTVQSSLYASLFPSMMHNMQTYFKSVMPNITPLSQERLTSVNLKNNTENMIFYCYIYLLFKTKTFC